MKTLRLNLLSPHKREKLKSLVRFLFIKKLLEMGIFTVALLAITHLLGWLMLTQTVNDLASSSLLVNRDFTHYNQEIKKINTTFKQLTLAAQEFIPLTPKILDIANTLPPDIQLSSISIDRATNSLVISGTAKTRNALLNYSKELGTIAWIDTVSAPRSQLLQKENISFEIRATLKNFPPVRIITPPSR